MELHRFEDRDALARGLADQIAQRLVEGVGARGAASLVVPGGSTPGAVFDVLAAMALPWDKVTVTLNDERWVDPDDPASNEHLVRTRLLRRAAAVRFVGLMTPGRSAAAAAAAVQTRLAVVARPFDVMWLGMGTDGHTASLFPGSPALAASLAGDEAQVQAVRAPGARGSSERMSLSLPALLDSRFIALAISGQDKLEVLRTASEPGDPLALPIRAVLSRAPVHVYWAP